MIHKSMCILDCDTSSFEVWSLDWFQRPLAPLNSLIVCDYALYSNTIDSI